MFAPWPQPTRHRARRVLTVPIELRAGYSYTFPDKTGDRQAGAIRREGGDGMCMLILEDEPGVADFLPTGCRESAYAVEQADNGIDGLENAFNEKYNAIVFDLMPCGMDGFSILR